MARFGALAFWKDQSVPVTVLQIIAFVSLIVALVFCAATIGVVGKEFKESKDEAAKVIGYTGDACFLFIDSTNTAFVNGGDNSYCEYIIYGQGMILISIIVLIALLLMTVFIRLVPKIDHYSMLHLYQFFLRFTIAIDLILFLVISVISLLFSFIASVVLSDGFAKTCSTIKTLPFDIFK